MSVLGFQDALQAELKLSLPDYDVQAREPFEGELRADEEVKQIFITREAIDMPDPDANLVTSARLRVPLLVSVILQRPRDEAGARAVFIRCLSVLQACQRAVHAYCVDGAGAGNTSVYLTQEQPNLIEGFYVSITGLDVEFELSSTGEIL